MTGQESFEDRFDHDPNAVYEDEEDEDLGPDDEFADEPEKIKQPYSQKKRGRNLEPPKTGGSVGALFKIVLSLCLIAFCYFYIFRPEDFNTLRAKITQILAVEKDTGAPVLPLSKKEKEETPQPQVQPLQHFSEIMLDGSGTLPDFTEAAEKRPALNSYLTSAEKITFETLNTHHELVTNMIADWAEETDEEKIAEIVQMPYTKFFYKTSASLLAQTLLKNAGLTPVASDHLLIQSPIQTMAIVYPLLKEAMATKTTVQEQIRTIEPVSSFLIYVCRDDSECMASWDLLIDMLGVKQFAKRLEKAPETVYMRK